MGVTEGNPDRYQALAVDARGLSLRQVGSSACNSDAECFRFDRCLLRPGVAAGWPCRIEPRQLSARSHGLGALARGCQSRRRACLPPIAGDIEAFLAAQFQTGAKSSSINRRLSSLRRFYRLQLLLGTPARTIRRCAFSRRNCRDTAEESVGGADRRAASSAPIRKRRWDCATAPCWRRSTLPGCACPELVGLHLGSSQSRHGRRPRSGQGQQGAIGPHG